MFVWIKYVGSVDGYNLHLLDGDIITLLVSPVNVL